MQRDSTLRPAEPATPEMPPAPLSNQALYAAGGLALVATVIAAVVPAFVGAWQTQYGISADQAAFVAATEFFAQVVGAGVFIIASRTWNWQQCAIGGLLVMILGNLASAASPTMAALIPSRAMAGLGGGALRALGMTCLARSTSPGRAFAVYATAEVAVAAVVTAMLPTVIAALGGRAPFIVIAAVAGAALFSTRLLPAFNAATDRWHWRNVTALPAPASWAVVALFLYFAGQGALWTFLGPIGKSQWIEQTSITHALTLLNIAGLIGSFGVGALAHRVNPIGALSGLLAIGLGSVLVLFNAHTSISFIASSCGFYFAWCASFPFQFTIIARADASGTASALVPAVDALGLAAGAALAGSCLPHLGVEATGWIWAAGSMAGISCFAIAARLGRNAIAPLVPDLRPNANI